MGIWFHFAQVARLIFWLLLSAFLLLQVFGGGDSTQKKRDILLDQFQSERKSRVIALIHRQESRSVLGVPVSSYINIEDSEAVLRAIRLTPDGQPIDLILHTPGGLVLAAEQIAKALAERKGPVDPQIGEVPASSILQVLKLKKPEDIDDQTLMMADIAAKARFQVASFVAEVLTKHLPKDKAEALAGPSVVYVPIRGLGEGKSEPAAPSPAIPTPNPGK